MISDLEKTSNDDFHTTGIAHPFTHTLDMSQAAFCTALIASCEGDEALRDRVWDWVSRWRNVYDAETGILGTSTYYEGVAWNYSFRLLHDMAACIDLHGGDDDFVADLERFFGYNASPVRQQVDPTDRDCMAQGSSLNRFEGFNNEPDMETPYAFIYAGRHDRTCEVVRAGMRHQFRPGRGGLPGNNDSGGLTSAYVWNAIGLFPVSGQPIMLIGSPLFSNTTLNLPQAQLRVVAEGTSEGACYVGSATLNGKPLDRAYLTMTEFCKGGELRLRMQSEPSDWARNHRPPSYQRVEHLPAK
jgi:putative alpha-1,2-mannosidase